MGKKNLKSLLLIVTAAAILLFTGTVNIMKVSAKASDDFTVEGGVLKQYLGSEKEIIIPKGVKTIGAGAFKEYMIEKVTIPDSVKLIEKGAFQNCSKLIEIVIPDSVLELGNSAFQGCTSLYRAKLSSELRVGMSAFADCTSLKEVIIPDGVQDLEHFAFQNCTSLELIDLPESINFIGGGCFENCTSLETILFPTQEAFIGYEALKNTPWLANYEGDNVVINHTLIQYRGNDTDITIPDNITVIGNGAFKNCYLITNVNIPMGVKEIGNSTFEGCSGLTEIVLPDSVTRVGSSSFYGCYNLVKITIPKNVNIRRDSLEGTKWMTDYQGNFIILNGNLLAYQGIDSKVIIPDNVTTVCTGAFFQNNIITEITIPKSVIKIDYAGFFYCKNLQKVFITRKNMNIEYEAFIECNSDMKLYGMAGGTVEEFAIWNKLQFVSRGLNRSKVTLYLGGNSTTSLKVNDTDEKVQWESEDVTIAKVSKSGKVTAVKTGITKVNATVNGIKMTCEIIVKKPIISKNSLSIMVGRTSRLNIIGISSRLTWSSSNKSIASVSNTGVVTANKEGTAKITTTINGKTYTCNVTVK